MASVDNPIAEASSQDYLATRSGGALFSVGSVEGVPFTACTSGPDIIILASNFSRVQQIATSSPISSLDCSTDVGKISASYDRTIVIFEPISLSQPTQSSQSTSSPASGSRLDYKWVQAASLESDSPVSVMSFNLEGTQLIAGGEAIQLWTSVSSNKSSWQCVWRCKTACNISYLKFSPDGTLFCSASKSDRLVKIWHKSVTSAPISISSASINNTHIINNNSNNNSSEQSATRLSTSTSPSPTPDYPTQPRRTNNKNSNIDSQNNNSQPLARLDAATNIVSQPKYDFSFIYIAHPQPITSLEWRRTSKYTSRYAVANILITSCRDNIARLWVQTSLPDNIPVNFNFHLAATIEPDLHSRSITSHNIGKLQKIDNLSTSIESDQLELGNTSSQFVVHWINNKEIHITRSIELLLHDMLIRMLKGNQNSSSTNSPKSTGESNSGLDNDTDDLADANDDTITAESGKKLRHKLCRKMNKQRALAASGRRDPSTIGDSNHPNDRTTTNISSSNGAKSNQSPSLVDEFDRTLESLMKKWQMSVDLLFSINKSDGTLTIWQAKYLDGEDTGVYRQVHIDKLSSLRSALPHYDSTTMSLNVTAYSPSAYLDVKRAYLAVTSSSGLGSTPNSVPDDKFQSVDVPEILSINTESGVKPTSAICDGGLYDMKDSASATSLAETEPSIFLVTQHLSGILGLWKLNSETTYPKVQSVDLVTRITGLPIDPSWLKDGILVVEYVDSESALHTEWLPDETRKRKLMHQNSSRLPFSPLQAAKCNPYNFDEIKSSLIRSLPPVDEEGKPATEIDESHIGFKDSYRASQMAISVNIIPQYHPKQLVELLAFGKLQRVKAILNHLMNCLVASETSHGETADDVNGSSPWAHRSRTFSVVANPAPSFHNSFDIDNPSSTIQQQVIEEIELDYIEVTSIKPLPLYSLLKADDDKQNHGDSKSKAHEVFSDSYDGRWEFKSPIFDQYDDVLDPLANGPSDRQNELDELAHVSGGKSLTSFNPKKAKLLTRVLTHSHLPGLSNLDQMHLLAVADAVASFDASPDDFDDQDDENAGMVSTNIAIDSLDDRGLRFFTAVRQHIYLTRCLPMKQRNELKAEGIGTHNLVWSFHSETQNELISLIPCFKRDKLDWTELREFGIGWWVKEPNVLETLITKVAQSAYKTKNDPLDAALFYLAMKRKTVVCALLRHFNCDKRLLKLFEQDFNDPVNRKKALKNAYALLGLHRFEHAAAFFILAGSIWDAVEVCINNLNDIQLAIILIRLHDNDSSIPNNLRRLLFTEILGSKRPVEHSTSNGQVSSATNGGSASTTTTRKTSATSIGRQTSGYGSQQQQYNYDPTKAHPDPFLRSMAFWLLGDYLSSVHTLLESDGTSISASVFNFYLFLKDKPLVTKHRQQLMEELELKKRHSPVDEEQVHCHRARSLSSGELGFDESAISRAIKQSSTEFEVLNETTRLVDKYSDESIAEKERILFFSTAQAYLDAGCPLLELEVLCSEDHLNMSKAQRMKFVACLHILMDELNTLANSSKIAPGTTNDRFGRRFFAWLKRSSVALNKICLYAPGTAALSSSSITASDSSDNNDHGDADDDGDGSDDDDDGGCDITDEDNINWIKLNEPLLRTMLTYCNLHSATVNSLTTMRLDLLRFLNLPQQRHRQQQASD